MSLQILERHIFSLSLFMLTLIKRDIVLYDFYGRMQLKTMGEIYRQARKLRS